MSSEYISGRAAVNLYGRKGAYTALFVKSVSSNVDPQTPTWGLYAFSKKEDAMDHVIKYAYYCDGGMTRGTRGVKISGETEISLWREAIANAGVLPKPYRTTIRFMDKPAPFELPIESLSVVNDLAVDGQFSLALHPLITCQGDKCGVEVTLDLSHPAHIDLIWDITRKGQTPTRKYSSCTSLVPAHDVFRNFVSSGDFVGLRFPKDPLATVVTAKKSNFEYYQNQLLKFQLTQDHPENAYGPYTEEVFVVLEGTTVVSSSSSVLGWFCRDRLIQIEAANPGTAESAYRAFKALHNETAVTTLSSSVAIVMKKPAAVPAWCAQKVEDLFSKAVRLSEDENLFVADPFDRMKALALSDVIECSLIDGNQTKNEIVQVGLFA
jgi:hypothetical protein